MKTPYMPALLIAVCLAGCSKTASAPKGQVVATVNGHEITTSDVNAEAGDLNPSLSATARKSVEQAAMQQIIARYIVADAARAAKLDNTPLSAILERRAKEQALVDMLQRKMNKDVPTPSVEEAKLYASDHPASFTQRRIFLVDQYIARNVPPSVLKQLQPLNTLEEVGAVLTQNKVTYSKTVGVIDALTVNPAAAEQIANLPPNAVFVSPDGQVVRINRVRETQIDPVLGDDAVRIAQEIIRNQRSSQLLQEQMGTILKAGFSKVQYNPAYRPAQPAPAPARPAKAPTDQPTAKS